MVTDRALALSDLEVSRKLWLERAWRDYSYVRTRQTSPDEVELTWIIVHDGRVAERSLLSSTTDARGLGDRMRGQFGQAPRVLWRELGGDIGRNDAGAPPLTMDQLYDLCRDRVLSVQSSNRPRLSFHRDGLLQHCGFLRDDCTDCAVASVQTIAPETPKRWQTPRDLLCSDQFGVSLPFQQPLTSSGCEVCFCAASNRSDPNVATESQGSGDICTIDPTACPRPGQEPDRANWICKFLLTADGCTSAGLPDLTPECHALPRPTSWSDPAWRHRCLPARTTGGNGML